jgi:hypothetical protein
MTKDKRRDPKRERFWRDAVSAWQASGLAVRDFCDRRGITRTAFDYWRKELRRRDDERSVGPSAPTFVPVTVLATPCLAVEVRCPSGHVVALPNCDPSLLPGLFAALSPGRPC